MKMKKRQRTRKFLMVLSALLFPVTMLYFSPGMVFRGARTGVLSGSYITFALLFLSALLFGRGFCGWICPGGGFGEICRLVDDRPLGSEKLNRVKYVIWVIWLAALAGVAVFVGGGFHSVDPLLGTERGFSIHSLSLYGFYYLVIGIILTLSLTAGRRGFCHTLCWMAPFMVLGRKIRNRFRWFSLHLKGNRELCRECGACEKVCPMSLPVRKMVKENRMENSECILCGACEDSCPAGAVRLVFGKQTDLRTPL